MAQKLEQLFPLRGELAELIRSKDWEQTPLGPPAGWSPSLHTVLRLMLASRYAMWLGWGPDLTYFYNDEYARKTLGPKHPAALGRSVREVWSEIWDTLRVRIEHVLATGEATWDEGLLLFLERNGYPEETYHTFSYSPAPGDSPGEVGGLFCVVIEETERVIGERHIGLLREFASLLNEAKTAEKDVFSAVERSLTGSRDVPFTLTYLFEDDAASARLVARTTVEEGDAAAPARVDLDSALWPFLSIASGGAPVVVELSPDYRWPNGPWARPPTRALVLPIAHQGHTRPAGVFIAGLNPHRPLDSSSRSFVELFVGQLSAGLSNARAYEEERKRSEALAALDHAKTAFFSNISHEFRTPLTLMIGPAEEALADSDEPLGLKQRERLELVHRNALRLGKLVNNLLDFARIEAGRVESSYVATDLAMATRELASIFQSATERAGLLLDLTGIEPVSEPVYVDRDQWEKIVLNLISNALKFTFEGSIRVGLHLVGDDVELTVADTGIGVAPTEIPRLFERFHRIRGARSRTHEGTGIGLALVQELARLHGGSVRATSELGKGTTFFVRIKRGRDHLPAERIEARAAGSMTSVAAVPFVEEALRWLPGDPAATNSPPAPLAVTLAASPSSDSEPRARVLVADDNQDMRNHLVRLLSGRYTVESVADGAEALRAVKGTRPDLVLADVMMPNMDGFELVRALRSDESTRDLPIMLLSARAGEEATREGLEAGADDYLVKPFSARELGARVDAQISRGRLRAAEAAHRKYITSVFESAPVGIAILHGPEHAFAFVNVRYLALLPHKRAQDLLGIGIRAALPELVGQGIYEILDNAYRTGEAYLARSFRLELARGNDGALETAFFDFEYQPIRNPGGAIDGIVVVVYEVTELVNARAEAEAANRAKDEFLAMLGHELRNPLAPIMTALELMELRGNAAPERTIIDRQVRHLLRLVDDLLDVSRITRDKIILSRESLDIADVITDAIETASPMFEQQAHRLRVTAPPGTLFVHGDRVRLAQVLANLLTNAAKYTDRGGEVEVTADAADDAVALRVRDNGQGLAPDLLPRVFDLFTQGTRTIERSQGGLGLGLAIVKDLVAAHGGTVTAASDGVGLGSVFTVSLPRIAAPPHVAAPPPEPAIAAPTGLRVLVVDDNEDGADLLDEVLRSMGHTTRVAHDGLAAVGAAAEFKPDVALIDIGLPVMDGYEVAAKLRETLDPTLRLIAVTGYGQASDRARALAAGFDHHLVKPVELDKLLALLERRS